MGLQTDGASTPRASSAGDRRRTVVVLSALTLVWLTVQAGAMVRHNDYAYPASSYEMFAGTSGSSTDYVLTARLDDGSTRAVAAGDLGLTDVQLRTFLRTRITADDAEGTALLERVARAAERRTGIDITRLEFHRDVVELDSPGRISTSDTVATWAAER